MTEQDLLAFWTVGLIVATALATLAAVLLIKTLRTAHQIEEGTGAAVEVIRRIRAQTEIGTDGEQANRAIQELNVLADSLLVRAGRTVKAQAPVKAPNGKLPTGGRS